MILGGIGVITPNLQAKDSNSHFELYSSKKLMSEAMYLNKGGRFYTLEVDDLGSIAKHSAITYKRIKAGEVVEYSYNPKSQKIDVKIYIEKEFTSLVSPLTRFYNSSGIDVKLSADGLHVHTQSLQTIVGGGISFINLEKTTSINSTLNTTIYSSIEEASDKYIDITLTMATAEELKVGSKVTYKEMDIGKVSALNLAKDSNIIASIYIQKEYAHLIKKDTRFWIEKFELSLRGVKNSKAAIFGANIAIMPGISQADTRTFSLGHRPMHTFKKEGLRITLKADRLSSLSVTSPLYYRQFKIGSIEKIEMPDSGKYIKLTLFIDKKYAHFVRQNAIFYNATAFGMDVGLFGVKIKTETVESMLSGGIVMVVPEKPEDVAKENSSFELHLNPKEEWSTFRPDLSSAP